MCLHMCITQSKFLSHEKEYHGLYEPGQFNSNILYLFLLVLSHIWNKKVIMVNRWQCSQGREVLWGLVIASALVLVFYFSYNFSLLWHPITRDKNGISTVHANEIFIGLKCNYWHSLNTVVFSANKAKIWCKSN